MDIKEIKQFLSDRGIDKHSRIERNGGLCLYITPLTFISAYQI